VSKAGRRKPAVPAPEDTGAGLPVPLRALIVLGLLFVFLVGVKGLGDGFKLLGRDLLEAFFTATANPFVGLAVGVLATTLVQSSSVTTSMIVGLVASPENPLPVANAVPMIMGANIGTTVTNTIVSLAHMTHKDEFRRAFSVATCHDFFNFMSVAVLLPLELATGFLARGAGLITERVAGLSASGYDSPIEGAISAGLVPFVALAKGLSGSQRGQGTLLIVASAALIVGALLLLVRTMKSLMQHRVEEAVHRFLGARPVQGIAIGLLVTVMVQSSSITTALLVPLAGAGMITIHQAFPITVGANIGTTVTALLASLAVSGANASAGVHIALVHLLFNVAGTLLVYVSPWTRRLPIAAAEWLAEQAVRSRRWALLYVVVLFYALPALLAVVYNRL
jgi:sodium-dependent phosphate cotransporter